MKITIQMLRSRDACEPQVDLFRKLFGEEVVLTKEIVMEHGHKFDLSWFVGAFMDQKALNAYQSAVKPHRDAYNAAVKPHRDAYNAAIQPHKDAYAAAIGLHWDAFIAAVQPHSDAYHAVARMHIYAYLKKKSEVFWNIISNS